MEGPKIKDKKYFENDLISVVVPIYKVEKYIDRCIKSIRNQTYKNLEIILIDDGSPDQCGVKCDEYARRDKRIKVIHKKNEGLSEARNSGIEAAKGKYITFIDSDDYIVSTYISFLYNLIVEENADIAIGKHYVVYPNRTINEGTKKKYILNSKEALKMCLYGDDLDVSAWGKLYKTFLFNDIRFPKGRIFEDSATTYKLLDKANKIVFESVPIYYYVKRENSIINKEFGKEKMELITSTEEMVEYVKNKYPDLSEAADRRLMYAYLSTLTKLTKANKNSENYKKYKSELIKYIKVNRKKILGDENIPKRDKVALYCLKLGYNFFKFSWKNYEKYWKGI